jgi:hypothetical protein
MYLVTAFKLTQNCYRYTKDRSRARTAISVTGVLRWAAQPQPRRGASCEHERDKSTRSSHGNDTCYFLYSARVAIVSGGFTMKRRVKCACLLRQASVRPSVRREDARLIFMTVDTGEFSECCEHIYMFTAMTSNVTAFVRPLFIRINTLLASYGRDR